MLETLLRAASGQSKTGHDFVKNQQGVVGPRDFAQKIPDTPAGADTSPALPGTGSTMMPAMSSGFAAKAARDGVRIIIGQDDGVLRESRRHARAIGMAEGQRAGTGLDQQGIRMAVVAAVEFDDFIALVNPRASRTALMHASVPELVMRTFWTRGTRSQMTVAIFTSKGFGMPKLVPRSAAALTAEMIFGCAWPRIAGSPGADVINQFVAIHVPDFASRRRC